MSEYFTRSHSISRILIILSCTTFVIDFLFSKGGLKSKIAGQYLYTYINWAKSAVICIIIHVSGQDIYKQVENPCLAADLCENLCYNCTVSAGTNGSTIPVCDSYCKPSLSRACSLTGSQSTQVLCL